MKHLRIVQYLMTAFYLASSSVFANDQQVKIAQIEQNISQAVMAMQKAALSGPTSVNLADQAKLNLQKDYVFIPKKEAANYMKAVGNSENPDLIGMIMPIDEHSHWAISIKYNPEGYVREDDADKWNADELLKDLKEGTEEANKERKKEGHDAIHVVGWIEKPNYDKANHKLIWSIEGKADVEPSADQSDDLRFVNYKTYAFGRFGYLELTLMTNKSTVEADKAHANNILKEIAFNNGYRYEDYKEGMDKAAAYGLTALIAGVAAKKLGLIALAGVFLLKIWKFIALGAFLAFGFIRRMLSKKKDGEQG